MDVAVAPVKTGLVTIFRIQNNNYTCMQTKNTYKPLVYRKVNNIQLRVIDELVIPLLLVTVQI